MFVLVVTGGLGAGKSTASAFFRERGAAIIDLDQIAGQLMAPGSPTLQAVTDAFGHDVLSEDGALDRTKLAAMAFDDTDSVAMLNAIVHPAVAREVGPALTEARLLRDQPQVVVMEVPLLVEAPVFAHMADGVLAVAAPEELRVRRAMRRGLTEEDARRRIALQASDSERAELADEVIDNSGTKEEFEEKLLDYWQRRVVGSVPQAEAE